jgi:hypothetical protein
LLLQGLKLHLGKNFEKISIRELNANFSKLASHPPLPLKWPSPPVSWHRIDRDSANLEISESAMSADRVGRSGGVGPVYEYDMEHSKVESWLDEHPDFFQVLKKFNNGIKKQKHGWFLLCLLLTKWKFSYFGIST